jgi:hypothetical protein
LPTEQRREGAKASIHRQSPCLRLHHAHAPPNMALEATGHNAGFFSAWVSVRVARASAWAFGGVRSPAVQRGELNEYGFRCRTPLVALSLWTEHLSDRTRRSL